MKLNWRDIIATGILIVSLIALILCVTIWLRIETAPNLAPFPRIPFNKIVWNDNMICVNISNLTLGTYTNTNSMIPVLDYGHYGVYYTPEFPQEVYEGDIVAFKLPNISYNVIHRISKIGYDQEDWYAIVRGDRFPSRKDKIRWHQIEKVLIAILY